MQRRLRTLIAILVAAILAGVVPAAAIGDNGKGITATSISSSRRPDDDDQATGDDDADESPDADDDDETDDDDDQAASKKKSGKDDDDTDDDDPKAKAFARLKRENRELKRAAEERERKAAEKSGRFEDLYKKAQARVDELEEQIAEGERKDLARGSLSRLNIKPEKTDRALRLMDLDDVEDKADADKAARDLKKEFPELFNDRKRSKRNAGREDDERDDERDDEDDDRDDDRNARRKTKQPVNRLRRGLEAPAKRR
jgi:hypothetical protein